jgi:DNA-directed RNA polymerase specialized sigma subunit
VNQAIEDLTASLGRAPFTDEIAKHLGISLVCWERMARELGGALSQISRHSTNQTTDPDDLLGMTKREAARAAMQAYETYVRWRAAACYN